MAVDLVSGRDPCRPTSLRDYLEGLAPTFVSANQAQFDESARGGQWIFLVCAANYAPSDRFNHWCPGYPRSLLGDDVYQALTTAQDAELAEELCRLYAELSAAEDGELDGMEDMDTEACLAVAVSKHLEVETVLNWQQLVKRCREYDFTPARVPADGNCLLWTFKSLSDLDYLERHSDPEHLEEVAKLRKQLVNHWLKCKSDVAAQEIMSFVHSPMQAPARKPENVKAEPKTPRKSKRSFPDVVDLDTPPGAADKQSRKEPRRVQQCRRAPGWAGGNEESPTLKGKKKKGAEVPNLPQRHKRSQRSQRPQSEKPMEMVTRPRLLILKLFQRSAGGESTRRMMRRLLQKQRQER